jgi:hypothetical protein
VGAGSGRTVFKKTNAGPVFETVNLNNSALPLTTLSNQASGIRMAGFTIELTKINSGLRLVTVRDSLFDDIEFIGEWADGDNILQTNSAIEMVGLSSIVTCKNNIFNRIKVKKMSYILYSDFDVSDNVFSQCYFEELGRGVVFGLDSTLGASGQLTGPIGNSVSFSTFRDIKERAYHVANGTRNVSSNNRYYAVGGNNNTSSFPVIEFAENQNLSDNDWFERSEELGYDPSNLMNVAYIPEVTGPVFFEGKYTHVLTIQEQNESAKLFKLPADTTRSFVIEYFYKSSAYDVSRKGTMEILVDPVNDVFEFSDDYSVLGVSNLANNLELNVQTFDENGDSLVDTIAIMMLNSTLSDDAKFYYKVNTVG